ncbi:protein fluG [Cladorrhinum sp. PSN259]|nr:protein fluG [Cladorrhinum sp. PSN259]
MAAYVGLPSTATPQNISSLIRAIRSTPVIDHHAHPLLTADALPSRPLLALTSEAGGDALLSSTTSLPHLRAIRQLASVLKCGLTWESVVAALEQKRLDSLEDWTAECLSGIETILLDDGLDNEEESQSIQWHDSFIRQNGAKCKRIVRIEKVAADIIKVFGGASSQTITRGKSPDVVNDLFEEWKLELDRVIRDAIDDDDVVAFKSVIAYRTGLDIKPGVNEEDARVAFGEIIENFALLDFEKLQEEPLNEWVVHRTAELIRDYNGVEGGREGVRRKKPIQFHTGLGDNDLIMAKASPSHLQDFVRHYPTVPIVLLHAGYPFTRETGYLASVYENVYADIGEVFPCVSQDGQERILKEILELCPWSKILWSTDGHWFPETYLLAILQMREVFETVLCNYVRKGHIGWRAAIELVQGILFKNANKLYSLGLEFYELDEDTDIPLGTYLTDMELFQSFLKDQPTPDFVRICWNDFTSQQRMRMVPFRKFMSLLNEGLSTDIGITKAVFGLIQTDAMIPSASATGEYRLHPDFSSLLAGPIDGHISMHGEFREPSGARVPLCPRSLLYRAVESGAEQGLSFLLGFEIEFLLVARNNNNNTTSSPSSRYSTLPTDGHAWSVSRYFADPKVSTLLRDMVSCLAASNIFVEQLHAESATGQFELILPPYPPVQAVDTLLHTRDIMSALATAAGYRLTLHPKPFANACGTAAHMHMSISSSNGNKPETYLPFYAGILKHLRAITAFTYSNPSSYDRVKDGAWAGGRWVTWGTQNRETAFRKIEGSHWELKTMDGLANPYFAVAAILFAGVRGFETGQEMLWGDCEIDPAKLTVNDRKELGVREMLPLTLEEALDSLKKDDELVELLGGELVENYVAIKEYELGVLGEMGEEERREWLMERY